LLATTEQAITLLFYTALVGAIVFCLAAPWFWNGKKPDKIELILLLSTGLNGGLGHYFFNACFSIRSGICLAPVTYLQLIMASFLSWFIFDSVPDRLKHRRYDSHWIVWFDHCAWPRVEKALIGNKKSRS
jgi:drug/metabolite transporter (DMT)-like permease